LPEGPSIDSPSHCRQEFSIVLAPSKQSGGRPRRAGFDAMMPPHVAIDTERNKTFRVVKETRGTRA
jgi:hypothetical protein